MANLIYYQPQTPVVFAPADGDITFTMTGVAARNGRISDLWVRTPDAGVVYPVRYRWRLTTKWAATPANLDAARLFLVNSAFGTPRETDNGVTIADAGLGGGWANEYEFMRNAWYLGAAVSNGTDAAVSTGGIVNIYRGYIGFVLFNGSNTRALSSTASDHKLILTPIPNSIQ